MYDLIIFDLDGTLVDTSGTVFTILNELRHNLNLDKIDGKDFKKFLNLGGENLISKFLDLNNDHVINKNLKNFRDNYLLNDLKNDILYDWVIGTLIQIKKFNIKTAILTNKPKNLTFITINKNLKEHSFDFIITSDDVINKKPDPEGLIKIINNYQIPLEKIVLIGDSILDQQSAHSAKIDFIWHRNGFESNIEMKFNDRMFANQSELFKILKLNLP